MIDEKFNGITDDELFEELRRRFSSFIFYGQIPSGITSTSFCTLAQEIILLRYAQVALDKKVLEELTPTNGTHHG